MGLRRSVPQVPPGHIALAIVIPAAGYQRSVRLQAHDKIIAAGQRNDVLPRCHVAFAVAIVTIHNDAAIRQQTDARGKTVHTVTDPQRGTTTSVTDPRGQRVDYEYDSLRRVKTVSTQAGESTYRNECIHCRSVGPACANKLFEGNQANISFDRVFAALDNALNDPNGWYGDKEEDYKWVKNGVECYYDRFHTGW